MIHPFSYLIDKLLETYPDQDVSIQEHFYNFADDKERKTYQVYWLQIGNMSKKFYSVKKLTEEIYGLLNPPCYHRN